MTQTAWTGFCYRVAAAAFVAASLAIGFVVCMNPYGNLRFSLPLEYQRVSANERYAYPGLIKQKSYDSVVVGTSTAMLLHPHALNAAFSGRFINLAMSSATPWEQLQMLRLFAHRHDVKRVIAGVDVVWCQASEPWEKLTFRSFPSWLYDDDPFNDYLYMANELAVIDALRALALKLGLRKSRFGPDGYYQFVPDMADYDLAKVRAGIYSKPVAEQVGFPSRDELESQAGAPPEGSYPDLQMLFGALDDVVPTHSRGQFRDAGSMAEMVGLQARRPVARAIAAECLGDRFHVSVAADDDRRELLGSSAQHDGGVRARRDGAQGNRDERTGQ